jgi:hypothetical protein
LKIAGLIDESVDELMKIYDEALPGRLNAP